MLCFLRLKEKLLLLPQLTDIELEHGIDLLDGVVVLTDGSSIAGVGTARCGLVRTLSCPC